VTTEAEMGAMRHLGPPEAERCFTHTLTLNF
jgi:hypothetical protein